MTILAGIFLGILGSVESGGSVCLTAGGRSRRCSTGYVFSVIYYLFRANSGGVLFEILSD